MDVDDKLIALYKSRWEGFCSSMKRIIEDDRCAIKPSNPLLLWIKHDGKEYEQADLKVVIFGRENNDWCGVFNPDIAPVEKAIDVIQEKYSDYYCEGEGSRKIFMQGMAKFEKMLKERYPGKKIEFVWNNIVKIGKARTENQQNSIGLPPQYILDVEMQQFNVVQEELEILNPDIVLFLTGPSYDPIISARIPDCTIEPLQSAGDKAIARVSIPQVRNCYRTNHPRYLRTLGKGAMEDYFNTIIDDIKL
ncbi:MAG: hypothetical protein LUE99_12620 [Bacteroides sp.]|nr:hypothetical protein [Bacteroides sp.]